MAEIIPFPGVELPTFELTDEQQRIADETRTLTIDLARPYMEKLFAENPYVYQLYEVGQYELNQGVENSNIQRAVSTVIETYIFVQRAEAAGAV